MTNSKLKVVGFACLSLLMAALMTVIGHSIEGLLWQRPNAPSVPR